MSWLIGLIGYVTILAIVYHALLFARVKSARYVAGHRLGLLFTLLFMVGGVDYVLAMFKQDTEATFWQRFVYMMLILISLSVALYFKKKEERRLFTNGRKWNT